MSKLLSPWKLVAGVTLLLPFTVWLSANSATISEGFESGTKSSYAAADVTLTTGVWNLNEAVIGNLSTDAKVGSWSARIRNSGKLTMKFDRSTGAGTVTIKHAKFGSDASTTWQFWCSQNSGGLWSQIGSTVTTSSTTLQTATFTPNLSGKVRCEVRKTDGTANRTNIDDIVIKDYSSGSPSPSSPSSPSPSPSSPSSRPPSLPPGSGAFFDNINNPVSGLAYGSPADVTPTPPVLNSFDNQVNVLCGAPGKLVTRTEFKTLINNNPTVLANIKSYVGGSLVAGRTKDLEFVDDLTAIWFNADGFNHVFCGEPVAGGAIGGLHFAGRYLYLQNQGLAGRLLNNTSKEEVVPGAIYTIGVIVKVGSGTAQSSLKGYPFKLNAESLLKEGAFGYKNNPNTSSTNIVCHLRLTDQANNTFLAVFVRRNGGIRTFYPDATPGRNPKCN